MPTKTTKLYFSELTLICDEPTCKNTTWKRYGTIEGQQPDWDDWHTVGQMVESEKSGAYIVGGYKYYCPQHSAEAQKDDEYQSSFPRRVFEWIEDEED